MTNQQNPTTEAASAELTRAGRTYRPRVDISETPEALWLWADMPGVDDKSVAIGFENGTLTIEGKVPDVQEHGWTPAHTEYDIGHFLHRFHVSSDINVDAIRARMLHGVLELELPKSEQARPRRIEVTGA